MNINNCCQCPAEAVVLSPAWFNELKGYQVHCMAKSCNNNQTGEYKRKGNAIRFWNIQNPKDKP